MAEQNSGAASSVDRTPASVLKAMAQNEAAYPKDDCLECAAVIRMGFFFDGFGRNRDVDKTHPTFYSNISRLWEAHHAQDDVDRPQHQHWFRFYYSGLGTTLNEDAKNDDLIYAATTAGAKLASEAAKQLKNAARNVARLDEVPETDIVKRLQGATQKSVQGWSYQPLVKAYKDVVKDVKTLPDKVVRIWNVWDPERLTNRVRGTLRGAWAGFKKNPFKVAWTVGKEAAKAAVLEGVPIVRDNETVAYLMGTGVDVRVDAALRQFKAAYETVNAESHVGRIEITVFGGDRGGVLAKQFINDLVKKYKRRSDVDLAIMGDKTANRPDTPIAIRFVGLLDSVASIMDENTFLGFLPFTDLLKQTYKDRTLTIPAAAEYCVHFGAAHELRRNQRLDSLEKTRGEQYLYPGSSGDVTGVSPEGALGMRGELSRVPLRDMLNLALSHGAAMFSIEGLRQARRATYDKFAMSQPISADGQTLNIKELVDAYREVVPHKPGIDFTPHMEVFLRWLAVRYQDPVFKSELSDPAEKWIKDRDFFTPQQEYNEELRRVSMMSPEERAKPENTARLRELEALKNERWDRAEASRGELPPQRFKPLWQRLEEEIKTLGQSERDEARMDERKKWMEANRPEAVRRIQQYDQDMLDRERARNRSMGKGDEEPKLDDPFAEAKARRGIEKRLLAAWREAADGKNPLPPKVMTLFDWLVHDAMLSSWPDHLLASTTLYFRVRDKDVFGATDFKAEMKQRGQDMQSAQRVDEAAARQAQLGQRPPAVAAR
ncbi:DUF2235 domain-containing protein [Achromobacter aloeverae]|uniref:Uncharacterized protein n=1 Tax=Achromobacter aloeverae TaxID=1750518 RepID=A0A4V1MRU0_9BURK|nr:DUF2235 domain-containing protein [Achromobacter aloeverae]RXN86221.1 hypothetical protein C7R54_21090 [Achromobacter aloeverae]